MRFLTHAAGRLGFAAVLFTAAAGVSIAAAPAAGAAPMIQQCQYPQGGTTYSSTSITVTDTQACPPFIFKKNVSIWQFSVNDTWVEVASGVGSATYTCKGSTRSLHYQTESVDFPTDGFYDNCN